MRQWLGVAMGSYGKESAPHGHRFRHYFGAGAVIIVRADLSMPGQTLRRRDFVGGGRQRKTFSPYGGAYKYGYQHPRAMLSRK